GNDEFKKMQKYLLKQQFEGFSVSASEGLHKRYYGFQTLLSQLEIHGAGVSHEDANQKFLRSLPSSWSQVALIMRTKPGLDTLSFDDLYNNLKVFERDVKERLHKGYDRFQTLLSQLEIHGAGVSHEDPNQKFLRSLPSSSSQVALIMKTKPGLDTLSFDDLYNNLGVCERDVKGTTASSSNTQNVAFASAENTSSTNDVAMISMRIKKFHKRTGRKLQFDTKDLVGFDKTKVECFNFHKIWHFARDCRAKGNQDSKSKDVRYNGNKTRDNDRRHAYQDDLKALVTIDGKDIDWSRHVEEDAQNYAMMAYSSSNSGSDNEVKSCSKSCEESYARVKKLYDDQRDKLSDASVEITAYTLALKKENYMPSEPNVEIDYSKFTYDPKQTSANESDSKPSEYASCKSDSSVETSTSMPKPVENASKDDLQRALKDKEIIDSGCSRHMTENKAHLADYQEFKGGFVAFGGSNRRITGKGKIKAGRQHNMYSFNLKNIDPSGDLACLFTKASIDESNKWHRRLGHVNFKNLNKLVNGNLVRGLPSKIFENDHTCVACQKGKQHKASCKFDGKSNSGFLVGYSLNSKAFRVYNLETKRVEENLHVNFLENKPNVAGKGHGWMCDLDYLTNSMNYEPVLVENQANKSAEINLNEEHFILPIWSAYSTTVKSSRDKIEKNTGFKTCEKPVSQVEQVFLEELEKLKRQEKEANDAVESLRKEATHDIQNASTSSTNLINTASTPLSIVGPSRAFNDDELLYPGPSKYAFLDDPLMPHLEDIYASPSEGIFTDSSYDDECVVTDFNNLETSMSVSSTSTTRIHTIHLRTQILGDPKSVVQTRSKVNKNSKARDLIMNKEAVADSFVNLQKYWQQVVKQKGLHKGYDRFQTLLCQLEIHGAGVSHEDENQKFLRSLPSSSSQVALIRKTKPGLDTLSFDDLYNNLGVAMISIRIRKFYKRTGRKLQFDTKDPVGFDKTKVECFNCHKMGHFARDDRAKGNQDSRRRDVGYNGNKTRDNGRRPAYHDDSKALVTIDGEDINWSGHVDEDAQNYVMTAYSASNSGSDNEVKSCSKACEESYARLKKFSPPMTGIYMPSGPDVEIDYSKFTYGPKQTSADELDSKPSEYASCESDSSVETSTSMPKPVENASKVFYEPKVWTDAPIIKEYESDSDNDSVSKVQEDKEKPSFTFTDSVKHVKTSRENIKETSTANHSPKIKKQDRNGHTRKGLGYAFTRKACFVCGSFSHLIRDCDFHEKRMAKQAELTKSKNKDDPHKALKDKGVIDSGYSRHMTGNKAHLADYQEFKGKGHAWMFDLDYLINSMNYEPVLVENQANKSAGPKEANNSAGTQANDDQGASSVEIDLSEEHFILPIWSAYSTTVKSSGDKIKKTTNFKTCEKPVSQVEQVFLKELEKLKRQEKEANDAAKSLRNEASHDIQNASTSSTNLINIGSTPLSIASPSRAFTDGELSYTDPSKYALPDDPSMSHLEDIYASLSEGTFTDSSYDDEDVVTDFNNLETTVSVSPTPTTRIHTIHPKTQILGDLKSAVQTRSKVNKNSKAHSYLPFGKKAIRTKWVYMNKKDEKGIVVRNKVRLVAQGHRQKEGIDYDEVFAPVTRIEAITIFLAVASYMGFIVYQIDVKSSFLYGTINKEVYVSKPLSFVDPKFPNKKSWCDEFEELMKNRFQMSSMGELTFFLRLQVKQKEDVCACSRFQVNPKTSHLHAVKRIFRYLKSQPKLGLWYPKVSSFDLEAYSDRDYAGVNLDMKFTTGEAEYVVAAYCCGQVFWIQNQLLDYGFDFMNTKIYIDNESTIYIVKNPVFHSKTKHIEIRHHFIRDAYEKKLIQVLKIHTDDNVADLLTKAFDVSTFNFLVVNIGFLNL
nr:hypothetical protein [Tanacetum cinerariifolium]